MKTICNEKTYFAAFQSAYKPHRTAAGGAGLAALVEAVIEDLVGLEFDRERLVDLPRLWHWVPAV
jgi:hypothetical protein